MIAQAIKSTLDAELKKQCKNLHIPGMALQVYHNGDSIYECYSGFRDIENKLPVDKDTIFGLASITKSLTSLAVMKLASEEKLDVRDKVIDWLPNLNWPEKKSAQHLEIRHLMSHTSGLPGLPMIHNARMRSILADPDGEFLFGKSMSNTEEMITNPDELIEQLNYSDFEVLGVPGEVFNYSNEGYGLLQKIIEQASKSSFIDYVKDSIVSSIGLSDSYFLTESILNRENVTELYAYTKGQKDIFHSPVWWDVGEIYTNGSWKASSDDVMKFAELLRVKMNALLPEQYVEEMTSPFVTLPNGGSYGFGIEINSIGHYTKFGHGGSIKGVSSNFQVVPEKGISACLLINMADVPAEKILTTILETILNVPAKNPFDTFDILNSNDINLRKFPGKYCSGEGHEVFISVEDSGLSIQREGATSIFYPISDHDFISKNGDRVYFKKDGDTVKSILLGKRVLKKDINT
jgi:CubicO group peptidase (beta-lactamase class C family)